ncbi:MAG: DNA repair protein RecN [Lachnospiraceae bacterium]|nr:DNA repair protein RecN [Lachnospiraceae bacterium]
MLISCHVKNFALIEEARIEFGSGLNVLTGETGAGKSILIDAISAGLGARAGAEIIRRGADEALIELVFSVEEEGLCDALRELDAVPEDGLLLISRRIQPNRSLCRINDEFATAARLRAVTELLLDIHGQNEHQSLLKPKRQLEILDEFAGEDSRREKEILKGAYEEWKQACAELESFSLSEEERLRRLDFLNYEIEEIERAAVRPGERDELSARHREMSSFEKIESGLGKALEYISEGRENTVDLLMQAYREVSRIAGVAPSVQAVLDDFNTAQEMLSEAEKEIRSYLEESRFDPQELYDTEKRLDELNRLELKYGDLCAPDNRALDEREEERDRLEDYAARREAAAARLETAEHQMRQSADRLSRIRRQAAPRLDAELSTALKELNFLSVQVETRLSETKDPGPDGQDEACFMISLNPGEPLLPLQKAASGGELSRIMLAIKTILADRDRIPTVIFDEIDSGISGLTARKVGTKLKEISRYRQVLLITHLPQIAAPADRHYEISKETAGGRTQTRIRLLDQEGAVGELARLMGGDRLGESVLKAARELKEQA